MNNFWRGRGRWASRRRGRYIVPAPSSPDSTRLSPDATSGVSDPSHPSWGLYFTDGNCPPAGAERRVTLLENYFAAKLSRFLDSNGAPDRSKTSYEVDVVELADDESVREAWPDLKESLRMGPHDTLRIMGVALHQVLTKLYRQRNQDPEDQPLPKLQIRVAGFGPPTPLREIRGMTRGQMVAVRGTVVRATETKPQYEALAFCCLTCGRCQRVEQPGGYFLPPTSCPSRGCRSRSFRQDAASPLTRVVDWQSLRLQELEEFQGGGRVPRILDCELTDDLVGSAVPGDVVTVVGTVELARSEPGSGFGSAVGGPVDCYLLANHVTGEQKNAASVSPLGPDLGRGDYYAIEAIHDEPQLFRLLVNSLCPAIYGHEVVKAGLLLALFGGVRRYSDDPDHVPVRGDPHVLVVGDPGLGKSQLLQACARVAPRGVYVCGNTATVAGLTVSVARGSAGEASLEAGALVLADRGCCCIDELDKMSAAQGALLEAMEQQCVSIAKAELSVSLPARAGVLAAANPAGGHYQRGKTVAENLRMGSALLSRFDLVFILLDRPDADLDRRLSEHVMSLHSSGRKGTASSAARNSLGETGKESSAADAPLAERLRGPVQDPVPGPLLRKYIAYARQYVQPSLGAECASLLQAFYLELRRTRREDCVPITTRQLESLVRLTQARARLELREACTAQDARDVVQLMKHSIADTHMDELGNLDFGRSQHGSGMSRPAQAKALVRALTAESRKNGVRIYTLAQLSSIARDKCGVDASGVHRLIDSLNDQGFLLKKGAKTYQLQTTDF
ncbi:DNA helicase MCM8 isoform X1 [Ixodes scapularis]